MAFNTDKSYEDKKISPTELLIDRRIARNYLFEKAGKRKFIEHPWRTVHADLIKLGEPEITTPVHLKNRWYSLVTKYKKLKNRNDKADEWPYFKKLDDFFNKKCNTSNEFFEFHAPDFTNQNEYKKVRAYRKIWTVEQTRLLIERRIMRRAMFEKKGWAFYGWQLVLSDLKQAGASDFSSHDIQKKWQRLCERYKIIMDKNCGKSSWIHFQQMNSYFKEKYCLKKEKLLNSKKENKPVECSVIVDWDVEVEKLSKCRLCQRNKSDHSLLANETLCERILQCTSLKMLENSAYLPSSICDNCKTTIDTYYEFLTHCHGVDKALRTSIPVLNFCPSTEVRNIYECAQCFTTFASVDMLQIHLKSHDKTTSFHCNVCNSSFTTKYSLEFHMKRHFTKLAVEEQNNENTMEYVNNSDMMENKSSSIDNVEININTETSDQYQEIISTIELIDLTEFLTFK